MRTSWDRSPGRIARSAAALCLAVAMGAGARPGATAQQGSGGATLRGTVFDSTEMKVLAGARVAVLGTTAVADADSAGRFELSGIPAGIRWVSFFHPRLRALGMSTPSLQVEFQPGERVDLHLAVPSPRTLLMQWCMAEQDGSGYAAVAGTVTDAHTGVPLPSAIVTAGVDRSRPGDPADVETRTDDNGYYRLCTIPAGREVRVQAHVGRSVGGSAVVRLGAGGAAIQDIHMAPRAEEAQGLEDAPRTGYARTGVAADEHTDVITRAEIEAMLTRVQNMGDLLRSVRAPALSVREVRMADATGLVVPGVCVEVGRASDDGTECNQAAIFVNDMIVPNPERILMSLNPSVIDRIEIMAAADAQLRFGTVAGNGAVLIYTR